MLGEWIVEGKKMKGWCVRIIREEGGKEGLKEGRKEGRREGRMTGGKEGRQVSLQNGNFHAGTAAEN